MLTNKNMKYTHEDGTPFTKEEFLQKLKTDKEFNDEFGNKGIDQIANLINDLKTNPDSRRLMVNAWNVGELDQMVLPPCHYGFQVYTRELTFRERMLIMDSNSSKLVDDIEKGKFTVVDVKKESENYLNEKTIPTRAISLMWNQRSVDTFLGLPFNIASYGLLLEIIAKAVNMVPDELIGNLGDVHLYSNHIEQAKEQIGRELNDGEIVEYYYKNIETKTKWKKLDNKYYYYTEEHNIWCEHSTSDIHFGMRPFCQKRTREPYPLPTLNINTEFWPYEGGECGEGPLDATAVFNSFKDDNFCKCLLEEDIQLGNYQSHPTIKAPLSN